MKIGIIGAGFTGLAAALALLEKGQTVTLFERESQPGGLALGFREKGWQWSLEQHYHHWFTNDEHILNLAKKISYEVIIKRPKTSVYLDGGTYQLDSPFHVLAFPKLNPLERLRMAAVLGVIKYDPFWQPLEHFNASKLLPKLMGQKAYKMLWEPQFVNKFGQFSGEVSLAWFWARLSKRTSSLAYPKKGFLDFAQAVTAAIEKQGGVISYNTAINALTTADTGKATVQFEKQGTSDTETFDAVIVTLPSFAFVKMAPQLPPSYQKNLAPLKSLGAVNLVLRLKKPFFADHTYWLSVCEKNAPVMAIVEHTNFMNKRYYNNEHLVYLGNYVATDNPNFHKTASELVKLYDPLLKKINPTYKDNLIGTELFRAPFAQPIIPPHYSRLIPPLETPLKNVYLANMQQVYPWDRGTNYAVELGEKVAALIAQ